MSWLDNARGASIFTKAVERARLRCAETGEPYCVIEIDKEDYREIIVRKLAYLDDPEFEAFDGAVLAEVYFDGTVQTHYVRSYA
jgi:CO dehydrogenase/acetyl-CoA synthase epsilon subunit